jgi:hypothetical protein
MRIGRKTTERGLVMIDNELQDVVRSFDLKKETAKETTIRLVIQGGVIEGKIIDCEKYSSTVNDVIGAKLGNTYCTNNESEIRFIHLKDAVIEASGSKYRKNHIRVNLDSVIAWGFKIDDTSRPGVVNVQGL